MKRFSPIVQLGRSALSAVVLAGSLVLIVLASVLLGSPILQLAVSQALIYVILVVALYIFVGNSGVVSFGHVSFMMIGAYVAAWQTCCPGLKSTFLPGLPDFLLAANIPVLPAALIAGLVAALSALLIGAAIMRLSGIAASIALFAVLVVLRTVVENSDSVTAGRSSIIGLPMYINPWVGLGWAVVAIFVAAAFQNSRWGLSLKASREDEIAARSIGVSVFKERMIALAVSAFLTGVGGALYGHFLGTVAVDMFWLDMTFITLAMLVIGGRKSLTGAVAGALLVSAFSEVLKQFEQGVTFGSFNLLLPDGLQELVLAAGMLATIRFRPEGLFGSFELFSYGPKLRELPFSAPRRLSGG
jgi:branched-chain amino acid transport system permease protein